MAAAVVLASWLMRGLPDREPLPPAAITVAFHPASLDSAGGPLRLAGAWRLTADDRRFGGLSALAIDQGRFLAVSDLGAMVRFDRPGSPRGRGEIGDLLDGPGPFGKKSARDAESIAPDPGGRGWWVGYEQVHSLWLYDPGFEGALDGIALDARDWPNNRGAEALLGDGEGLLVLVENGRQAIKLSAGRASMLEVEAGADIAEAAIAPDGSRWVLLRSKGLGGIAQSIAPLSKSGGVYRVGPAMPVPKAALDNYEGMAIEARPGGGWRFWLVSDDGHRLMARTLLVALDYDPQ